MRHPFESIPPGRGRLVFLPALALYVVVQVVMVWLDAQLQARPGATGIVPFELAGSAERAGAIIAAWGSTERLYAAFGLGLDYLFMLAYSTVVGFACVWAGRMVSARGWPLGRYGGLLAWGLWLAVLLDASENVFLLTQLVGGPSEQAAQRAAACAVVKFALIAAGLLYAAFGAAAVLMRGRGEVVRAAR